MVIGKPFEVTKEVYDRAKENCKNRADGRVYMMSEDRAKYFNASILCGYGLYDCQLHEEDGKYICTWMHGSSCD